MLSTLVVYSIFCTSHLPTLCQMSVLFFSQGCGIIKGKAQCLGGKRWWSRIVNQKTKEKPKKMTCLHILYMSIYRTPSQAAIWYSISVFHHLGLSTSILRRVINNGWIKRTTRDLSVFVQHDLLVASDNDEYILLPGKKISSLLASVALFSLASPHTFLSNPSKSALLAFHSPKIHRYNICCIPKKPNLFKGRLFLLPKSLPFLTPS